MMPCHMSEKVLIIQCWVTRSRRRAAERLCSAAVSKSESPRQILGLMVVRKLLDMVFSQHDLAWIDDVLPVKEKKKKSKDEDKKKKGKEKRKDKKKTDDLDDEVRNAGVCCPPLVIRSMTWIIPV